MKDIEEYTKRSGLYNTISILYLFFYLSAAAIDAYCVLANKSLILCIAIGLLILGRLFTISIPLCCYNFMGSGCCYYYGLTLLIFVNLQSLLHVFIIGYKVSDNIWYLPLLFFVIGEAYGCFYLLRTPLRRHQRMQYVVVPWQYIGSYPNYP